MSNIKLVHSGGNSVSLTTPTNNPSSNVTFKLPQADGSANQLLKTDGSGNLGWATDQGGKILQVIEATSSTTVTTSGGTEADLLTISITPASSSNKVMVFCQAVVQCNDDTNAKGWIRVYRGTASGTLIQSLKFGIRENNEFNITISGQKLDSPSTSSAQTYTMTLTRLSSGTASVSSDGNPYHLQAMEVSA